LYLECIISYVNLEFTPNNLEFTPNNLEFTPNNLEFTPNNLEFTPNNLELTVTIQDPMKIFFRKYENSLDVKNIIIV